MKATPRHLPRTRLSHSPAQSDPAAVRGHVLRFSAARPPPATRKSCHCSRLALAWLLAQGDHIVPIPASRSPKRVEENLVSLDLKLTADDMTAIEAAIGDGPQGARNSEGVEWD
jgi:aryl-alcohol dehydrogenase-like predicted oxidoreductase